MKTVKFNLSVFSSVLISFFILFGCASPEGEAEPVDDPADIVNMYHQAILDQDVDQVMALSAPEESREYIEDVIVFRSEAFQRSGLPRIKDTEIDGEKAVVTCMFGPVEQNVNLRKVEGEWKVYSEKM